MRGIEAQFLALQKGFNELIPQHLLKPFDEKELEVSITSTCHGFIYSIRSIFTRFHRFPSILANM